MYRSWLLVVILGCAGGAKSAQTTAVAPPTDPQSCAKVADHVVDLMSADAKDAPPEKIKSFHDGLFEHCDHDQWSVEMRKCLVSAAAINDSARCNDMLTDAQRSALTEAAKNAQPAPSAQPAAEPAPGTAPPAKPASRGSAPKSKKGGDPCEGGE